MGKGGKKGCEKKAEKKNEKNKIGYTCKGSKKCDASKGEGVKQEICEWKKKKCKCAKKFCRPTKAAPKKVCTTSYQCMADKFYFILAHTKKIPKGTFPSNKLWVLVCGESQTFFKS